MGEESLELLYGRYARKGDVGALARVFDLAAPDLGRLALRLVRDQHLADDLVQETFLFAVEQPQTFDAQRKLMPWLVGVLVNRVHASRRREARTPDPDRLPDRPTPTPVALASLAEYQATVATAVAALPGDLREVVEARLAGVQTDELADRLGVARGTMRVRLHRGLQRLRAALPAGLATALAVTFLHTKSQAATRASILKAARQHPLASAAASITTATGLATFLAMKKTLAATALALVSLATLQWSGIFAPRPDGDTNLAPKLATETLALSTRPEEESSHSAPASADAMKSRQEVAATPKPVIDEPGPTITAWPADGEDLIVVLAGTETPGAGALVRHVVRQGQFAELILTAFVQNMVQGQRRPLEELGTSTFYQADDLGRVRIPTTSTSALVIATLGEKVGYLPMGTRLPGGDRIELAVPEPLIVRVMDDSGSAVPGYPISSSPPLNVGWAAPTCTDNQGEYRLEHFNTLVVPFGLTMDREVPSALTLFAGLGETGPSQTLRPGLEPHGPIELVIPTGGTVHVSIAVEDEQPGQDAPMEVTLKGDAILAGRKIAIRRGEVAKFGGLHPGAAVTVGLDLEGSFNAVHRVVGDAEDVSGIVPSGEPLPMTITLDQSVGHFIAGRLVDSEGRALRSMGGTLVVTETSGGMSYDSRKGFHTTPEGRFALPLRNILRRLEQSAAQLEFAFWVEVEPGKTHMGSAGLFEAGAAWPLDLGDISLALPPVLIAGQVVDENGEPIVDAEIQVLGWDSRFSRMDSLGHPTALSAVVGLDTSKASADGRFEVLGTTAREDIFLQAKTLGHPVGHPVPFPKGLQDFELVIKGTGVISGSIDIPVGQAASLWSVRISNQDLPARDGYAQRPSKGTITKYGAAGAEVTPNDKGEFAWPDLRPGSYTMTLSLVGRLEPFAVYEDVQVVAGEETLDPRLQGIHTAGVLDFLTVRIEDPKGQPIPGAGLVLIDANGSGFHAEQIASGEGQVAVFEQPTEVIAAALGFRAVRVPFTESPLRIELEPAFEVELALPTGVTLGANQVLLITLRPMAGPDSKLPKQVIPRVELAGRDVRYPAGILGAHGFEVWVRTDSDDWVTTTPIPMGDTVIELGAGSAGARFEIPVTQEMIDEE